MQIEFFPKNKNGLPENHPKRSISRYKKIYIKKHIEATNKIKLIDHRFLFIGIQPSSLLQLHKIAAIKPKTTP